LLVCDFKSEKILLFDNRLEHSSVVMNNSDVCQPRRLSYQWSTGHLLVGQFNGVVGIYKLVLDAWSTD
jgi:hypothetical protein